MASKKLILVGDSPIAEVAYEYFTHDSDYEVVAFAVEKEYLRETELFGVPVVPFETVAEQHPPSEAEMFVAVGYTQHNRLRARLYEAAKAQGFTLASYVSSRAFVWRNVEIGDNCFIFEDNTIQPFVKIGNNVVLWSGNHIGHHSVIRDHNFISSHVVISGFCDIQESCFLGVNATIANNVTIARDGLLGAGAIVLKDTEPGRMYATRSTAPHDKTVYERFGIGAPA